MIIPKSVRMVYCSFGGNIAFGAYGSKEDVTRLLDTLYNYGGHKDDNVFMSENFGYVLTSKEKLAAGFRKANLGRLLLAQRYEPREARVGVWETACAIGDDQFESIEHESFLTGRTPAHIYDWSG